LPFGSERTIYTSYTSQSGRRQVLAEIAVSDLTDPNEVIVPFEARNLARANSFSEFVDLRETMLKLNADFVARPDMYFLNDLSVGLKVASGF